MNSFKTRGALAASAAALALVATLSIGSMPLLVGLASALSCAVIVCVALLAQWRRFDDENRLVYKPVYVRRSNIQRRVSSDD